MLSLHLWSLYSLHSWLIWLTLTEAHWHNDTGNTKNTGENSTCHTSMTVPMPAGTRTSRLVCSSSRYRKITQVLPHRQRTTTITARHTCVKRKHTCVTAKHTCVRARHTCVTATHTCHCKIHLCHSKTHLCHGNTHPCHRPVSQQDTPV